MQKLDPTSTVRIKRLDDNALKYRKSICQTSSFYTIGGRYYRQNEFLNSSILLHCLEKCAKFSKRDFALIKQSKTAKC